MLNSTPFMCPKWNSCFQPQHWTEKEKVSRGETIVLFNEDLRPAVQPRQLPFKLSPGAARTWIWPLTSSLKPRLRMQKAIPPSFTSWCSIKHCDKGNFWLSGRLATVRYRAFAFTSAGNRASITTQKAIILRVALLLYMKMNLLSWFNPYHTNVENRVSS